MLWGLGRCLWLLIFRAPDPLVFGCQRAALNPFTLTAQQKLCGCSWTLEEENVFPKRKPGDGKAGGQAQQRSGAWWQGMWLGTGGDSPWGLWCAWHGLGSVWARGGGASGGGSGAGVQQCRGVSAMQGGSAPGTAAAAAGWALARGGHPVRAMSQTGVGGNGKEQCVCSEEGNRSCWRRVWGCLVTVQRGGCCAAVAVRRGWALPGAARGVPALQRSLGRDPVSL